MTTPWMFVIVTLNLLHQTQAYTLYLCYFYQQSIPYACFYTYYLSLNIKRTGIFRTFRLHRTIQIIKLMFSQAFISLNT